MVVPVHFGVLARDGDDIEMPTSNEDLQKLRDEVESLRGEVKDAEAERQRGERELANDVTKANLEREREALKARLATAKAAAEKVKTGEVPKPLTAKEQMEAAAKAAESQSDTAAKKGGN